MARRIYVVRTAAMKLVRWLSRVNDGITGVAMRSNRLGSSIAAWALIAAGIGPAAADPRGLWQANDGSRVRIANCGAALCGTLASMNTPTDPATGRPWTDKYNPDPSKRDRPLIGLRVLISMQPSGAGKWSGTL